MTPRFVWVLYASGPHGVEVIGVRADAPPSYTRVAYVKYERTKAKQLKSKRKGKR